MAQTRRRRHTKHRGNAAGVVESRGRTGRKPTAAEKNVNSREAQQKLKLQKRQDRPPTWGGAFTRALVAAVLMVAILLVFKISKPGAAFALFPIVLLMYVPISYYTDRWMYNRRKHGKSKGGDGRKATT